MDHTTNSSRVKKTTTSKKERRSSVPATAKIDRTSSGIASPDDNNELPTVSPDNATTAVTSTLIREAEDLIGVKYQYAGNSPSRGFDCSGFTCYVYDKVDVGLPRTSTDQSRMGRQIPFDEAQTGDLVFFGTGQRVTHVALVVDRRPGKMEVVHSTSSRGVIRDEIFSSSYWRSRKLWAVDMSGFQ